MINIAHTNRNVFLTDIIDIGTIRALVSPNSNANLLRSKVALSAVKARKPRSTTSAAMRRPPTKKNIAVTVAFHGNKTAIARLLS